MNYHAEGHVPGRIATGEPERVMSENPELTDQSLLRRWRSGDEDAATAIYARYASQLRRLAERRSSPALATRVEADDIVQSVFRTFFRRARERQYDVPNSDDLWRLFLVIGLNKIRNAAAHHQAAKRDVRQTVSAVEAMIPDGRDDESHVILNMVIEESLAAMPESSRTVIRLRLENREVQEIADRTGRSKRSVERILQQYREQLRVLFDDADVTS